MTGAILLVGAALGAFQAQADTVLELRRGDRVVVEGLSGDLTIEAWGRDVLEVASDDGDGGLVVRRAGADVLVELEDGRRRGRPVDATLRVPAWVDVEIGGLSLDVSVEGLAGALRAANVGGDIRVRNADGPVDARSIEGDVLVENAVAGVRASSQSEDVTVRGASGTVEVHSGSGDVTLVDVASESVRAETQDGNVSFSGTLAPGGSYGFFVHDGDATITVPAGTGARVSVSTFDGDFQSEFPVVVQRFTGGREFEFVLGDGDARLRIEVFDGEIRLLEGR